MIHRNTRWGFTRGRHLELVSGSCRYPNGFTLVELLVVVLIIGILAAVAVPQYRVAVAKTRLMTYYRFAQEIRHLEEVYYLENNTYAIDVSLLGADYSNICSLKDPSRFSCPYAYFDVISSGTVTPDSSNIVFNFHSDGYKWLDNTGQDLSIKVWFAQSSKPNQTTCQGFTSLGQRLCTQFASMQ